MSEQGAVPGRGMVVTSHPEAVRAGERVLADGGSAVDAAVAAAAVLTVVDPRSTGLAGDLFAQVWTAGEPAPVGLAAAGVAPVGLTVDAVRAAGHTGMPRGGPWSITVPGAPAGWTQLLTRFGRLDPARVIGPAIALAADGFVITPVVATEWLRALDKLRRNPAAAATFLPGDQPPDAGGKFANPELAATLRRYVEEGDAPFYRGDLATAMADAVEAAGGPLRASDLAEWAGPEWVQPVSAPFRGIDVFQMPPPGQGVVVLESLGIYGGLEPGSTLEADHLAVESMKLAIDDVAAVLADPAFGGPSALDLLAPEHLAAQRARIGAVAAPIRRAGVATDTVYVAAVDGDGNACSLIQSLFEGFGSGIGVPGTGLVMHNRGSGFVLEDGHPNRPEPRKRPFHTIIPAMLGSAGEFFGCLGVVGGFMQPQGQLQVLRNLLDRGMTPQQAVDAPRFRVFDGLALHLEEGYDPELAAGLAGLGHDVQSLTRFECGGAQLLVRTSDGELAGGTDFRKDGLLARC